MHELKGKVPKTLYKPLLFFAGLFATAIIYCLFPTMQEVSNHLSESLTSTHFLTVKVISAGKAGSEVWITTAPNSAVHDLRNVPAISDIIGECEYRTAEEYGYAFDFLVSYGENLGSVLKIPYNPSANASIMFYCQGLGGIVELIDGECDSVIFDTYSPTGEMKTFHLEKSILGCVVLFLIMTIMGGGCTIGIYLALVSGCWITFKPQIADGNGMTHRDSSIDIVRMVAAFGVIYVHSFLAATPGTVSYYATPLVGPLMFGMTMLRM